MLNNSRRGAQVKGNRQADVLNDTSLLLDSLRNEVSILSRKLGSKTEALAIMAKELEQCRQDRDQFRALLEQLRGSHKAAAGSSWSAVATDAGLRHQLALSRQQCAELQHTVTELTVKMEEVCGDMMVLRRDAVRRRCPVRADSAESSAESTEDMVHKMEQLQDQCDQLRRDLELTLDEKEELVTQRDAYKGKTHRLNHQLQVALRAPADSALDVDSLVTENRYLREQLSTSQDELERLQRVCSKYKSLLEARKKKGILRPGSSDSSALIVTKRQVAEMLRSQGDGQLLDTPATLSDLRSLCAALLEQLQDKCTALTHQRKANRLLAEQCAALRQQAARHGLSIQPSADLMAGYSATHIDRESEQLLADDDPEVAPNGADSAANPRADGSAPPSPARAGAAAAPPATNGAERHSPPDRPTHQPPHQSSPGQSGDRPTRQPPHQSPGQSGGRSAGPATPARSPGRPQRRPQYEDDEDEEILSIQELDRYVRCLRRPAPAGPERDGGAADCAPASPARSQADSEPGSPRAPPAPGQGSPRRPAAQPAVQVVGSPVRSESQTAPPGDTDSGELPAELERLYRQALDQLRAGDQAT
ncbi:coiled-coil domain-containing protein 149-like [Amphibalanus amphitrite]|uniref:coiled-coil domain-containing protein 149-like n=1 Tax=Amphibalanus amphitrite TaxID=1232801 RepID=UPI001C907B78|nr:coiled-coil domain-containing protein 149-like [Amphibalanus amphitrite]